MAKICKNLKNLISFKVQSIEPYAMFSSSFCLIDAESRVCTSKNAKIPTPTLLDVASKYGIF